jgi:cyclophilin family peptidyl-prolyl cis-trans isomerase
MKLRTNLAGGAFSLVAVPVLLALVFTMACAPASNETETEAESSSTPAEEPSMAEGEGEGEGVSESESELAEEAGTTSSEADIVGAPRVVMETSLGRMVIELDPETAPKTVENFLQYVRDGFYDGTTFHRVVPGFVIQGGGFTAEMVEKDTRPPIENEADNGLRNARGTICMARTPDPHSATSQFFINTKDNPVLDFRGKTMRDWGYAVFGKVIEGLDVVDAIEKVPTTRKGMHDDVPVDPVVIDSARVVS